MKPLKPGQLCTINQQVYRAKKRTIGCLGCDLDHYLKCPNIVFANVTGEPKLNCIEHAIILKKQTF